MSRTHTTITAVGAALVLALPATALGQSSERFGDGPINQLDAQATEAQILRGRALDSHYRLGDYAGPSMNEILVARERAFEAKAQSQSELSPLDAREESFAAKHQAQLAASPDGPDVVQRAVNARTRDLPTIVVDDRFRIDPTTVPEPGPVQVTDGRDIEWPQVGFGLALGALLMIGLYLALRVTRHRPLAH